MRTTVRKSSFGIDRMKLALVAAGILVTGIIATTALNLSNTSSDDARSSPHAITVVQSVRRPTDRGVGLPWEHSESRANSGTENLEANGLPIAPIAASDTRAVDLADQMARYNLDMLSRQYAHETGASDHPTWIAFPGHEGFIGE